MPRRQSAEGSQRAPAQPLHIRARAMLAAGRSAAGIHDLLSSAERERLLRIATVVDLPGRRLRVFSQGDSAEAVYIVGSGAICVCRDLDAGGRQVLEFLYPGDLLGLAENGRYVNSAQTLTASHLFRIPYAVLSDLLQHDRHMQIVLLVKLAHELRAAQRHIIMIGSTHVVRRLASLLGDLCLDSPYYSTKTGRLTLPLTRSDIGDYLGASAEAVTRAFAVLERERLLRRETSKTVLVADLARLLRYGRGTA
jgi:CRP-like cAMP-binding protein